MDNGCNFTYFGYDSNKSFPKSKFDMLQDNCSSDFNFNFSQISTGPDKNTESAFKLIFYFFATVGNFLLLYVMYRDPLKRFRNSPSYFIGNLMTADLVSIVSGICQTVFQMTSRNDRYFHEVAGSLAGIGVQCSFLIIMIFAIDRFMAIARPYKYKNIMARKPILVVLILFPWCFAIIALPLIYFAPAFRTGRTLTNLFAGDIIALTVVTLIVHPLTHWSFKTKIKNLAKSTYMNKEILTENLKVAKVLATTVLMVSVCLITFMSPFLVAFSFSLADCNKCFLSHAFLSFWKYYPLLRAVRLMTNSLVYAWRLPLYRQSLKALVFKHLNMDHRLRVSHRIHNLQNEINGSCNAETLEKAEDQTTSIQISKSNTSLSPHGVTDGTGIENVANECEESTFNSKF